MLENAPLIIVAGEAIYDLIPTGDGVYEAALGGSSFNTAIGLGRLGAPVSYCGRLSRDAAGEQFMARLAQSNVDASLITRTREPSALALVAPGSAASGPRYALYLKGTAHDGPAGLPAPWPQNAVHLHVASFHALLAPPGAGVLAAMRAVRGVASISFDPNIRPPVLPSREATVGLVEERVAALEAFGLRRKGQADPFRGYIRELNLFHPEVLEGSGLRQIQAKGEVARYRLDLTTLVASARRSVAWDEVEAGAAAQPV